MFMKEGEGAGPRGSEGRCQEGPSLRSSGTLHAAEWLSGECRRLLLLLPRLASFPGEW